VAAQAFMMENGKMDCPMDKENSYTISIEANMKVNFLMDINMAMVLRFIHVEPNT